MAFHNIRVTSPKGLSILVLISKYIWWVCVCVLCLWEREYLNVGTKWYCIWKSPPEYSCVWASVVSQKVKKSSYNTGDLGSIPGLERSPGGRHGNPLQYSCLENPHGQRSLAGYCSWGHKEWDTTKWLRTFLCWFICENNCEMIEDWQSWFKNWRAWNSILELFYLFPSCPYRD